MTRGTPSLVRRLQGRFWQHSGIVRGPLRRLRRAASLALHRLRRLAGSAPTRVVAVPATGDVRTLAAPLVAVSGDAATVERFLAGQTERAAVPAGVPGADAAAFHLAVGGDVAALSPTHLEAAVLAAVAEDLPLVAAGWAAPAASGTAGEVFRSPAVDAASALLLRARNGDDDAAVVGRLVPQVTGGDGLAAAVPVATPLLAAAGSHLVRGDVAAGRLLGRTVWPVDRRLVDLPTVDGPPTVLFLLPYLAVGGAERLLVDLLDGLGLEDGMARALVVTLEPHRAELGQTVDVVRRRTPHVYTLGDWLPREAHLGALAHLLRRYRVATLFSWNGTVLFYDRAAELGRRFPELRIVHQLFHHRGGWTERLTLALRRRLDVHVAVNRPIAAALRARGAAAERVAVVHHGVAVPDDATLAADAARRRELRRELGLPADAVVAGTFIRLHPQKRPLDVLRLARRLPEMHFLLVGGGPLDGAVDRALHRRPLPNLVRLPMRADAAALYPALDLCLMTSRYEGLPVFLLDGMARGLPAVAPAVGDVPLLFADGGGIAVDRPGDLGALAAALRRLRDPEARRRAGEAARRTVAERFGVERYRRANRELIFPELISPESTS